jgi:hypothetical protein
LKLPFPKYEAETVAEIEAYLDMHYQTEIVETEQMGPEAHGLKATYARGLTPNGDAATRNVNNYARPMFQVLPRDAFSCGAIVVTPCRACDDFSRSWACEEHHELPWDAEKGRFQRPDRVDAPILDTLVEQYRQAMHMIAENQFPPVDGRRFFTQAVQDEERHRQVTSLFSLPSFTMTLEGTFDPNFLEITGETVQGTADTVRIEVERRG